MGGGNRSGTFEPGHTLVSRPDPAEEPSSSPPVAEPPGSQSRLKSHTSEGAPYELFGEIASGGMASVRYGRRIGPLGFARPVAVKRLHAQFASNPDFVSMFLDEARLSARLVHANIVATLDVLEGPGEVSLVMEYVHGEALGTLLDLVRARGETVPVRVATALVGSVLHGLHAAHEATDEQHRPLHVVHRDVSPQNILVGADGVPRLIDFGIARALGPMRSTPSGEIKGKLAYIAPEQLKGAEVDRRADVYGAAVVLWETLVARVLFDADSESALVHRVLTAPVPAPSAVQPDVPRVLDEIVLRGLARMPSQRFATALDMALELERAIPPATQPEISSWLDSLVGDALRARARTLTQMQEGAERAAPVADGGTAIIPETRREDARPSIRVRWRRKAMGGWVAGLLLMAAVAAVLSWLQLREAEPRADAHLLKPADVAASPPKPAGPGAPSPAADLPVETSTSTATDPDALEEPATGFCR